MNNNDGNLHSDGLLRLIEANEPFWGAMRELDQEQMAKEAGFPEASVRFDTAPMAILEAMGAAPPADPSDEDFAAGEFAPGGGWEVLIARKGE